MRRIRNFIMICGLLHLMVVPATGQDLSSAYGMDFYRLFEVKDTGTNAVYTQGQDASYEPPSYALAPPYPILGIPPIVTAPAPKIMELFGCDSVETTYEEQCSYGSLDRCHHPITFYKTTDTTVYLRGFSEEAPKDSIIFRVTVNQSVFLDTFRDGVCGSVYLKPPYLRVYDLAIGENEYACYEKTADEKDDCSRGHYFIITRDAKQNEEIDTAICWGETFTYVTHDKIVKSFTADDIMNGGNELVLDGANPLDRDVPDASTCGKHDVHLHLQFKTHDSFQEDHFCSGQPYIKDGWDIPNPINGRTYTNDFTAMDGCDSVANIRLIEDKVRFVDTTAYVCPGDSFWWRGAWRSVTGPKPSGGSLGKFHAMATDFFTYSGCDSIIKRLYVREHSYSTSHESATVCYGSTYQWKGHKMGHPKDTVIYVTGRMTLRDTIVSKLHNCRDSICILNLNSTRQIAATDTANLCEGDVYEWKGHTDKNGKTLTFTEPGDYYDTLKYSPGACDNCRTIKGGCDSIVKLQLIRRYVSYVDTFYAGCAGTLLYLPDSTPVRWYDDKDTTVTLMVPHIDFDPVTGYGIKTWIPAKNRYGCDSIYRIKAHIVRSPEDKPYRDTVILPIAPNLPDHIDYKDWHNLIDKGGHGYDTCDTFSSHAVYREINGRTVTIFEGGCDSVVCLHVKIVRSSDSATIVDVCAGESYFWEPAKRRYFISQYIPKDTVIVDTVVFPKANHEGQDSICMLYLTGHPTYNTYNRRVVQHKDTLCIGDTIIENGRIITRGGHYIFPDLKTIYGCDSVVNFTVVQAPKFDTTIIDSMCHLHTYTDFGFDIESEFGDFTAHYLSRYGCDSIYRLHLTEITSHSYLIDTACQDEPYILNGDTLWASGYYEDTLLSDSCRYFYHLNLTVIPKPKLYVDDIVECADATILKFPFTYVSPTAAIRYRIDLSDSALNAGFQNISRRNIYSGEHVLDLPMPTFNESNKYVTPDTYKGTIHVWNQFCDSVSVPVGFTLYYPASIFKQKWNDWIGIKNESYNGGFSFTNYEWYCDGQRIDDNNNSFLYYTHDLPMGKEYIVYLTRASDGKTIPTCPFLTEDRTDWTQPNDTYISVNPTWVSKTDPTVTIATNIDGNYSIFDLSGKRVGGGEFVPCEHDVLKITLPTAFQLYILFFQASDGFTQIEKIHVH